MSHAAEGMPVTGSNSQFKAYLMELQNNPDDKNLRIQIIQLVSTTKLRPAISDAVDEFLGQAKYFMKKAKAESSDQDYLSAADAFGRASDLAPWVGEYYYNRGFLLAKANRPADAITQFEFYLISKPDEASAKTTREAIGMLKAKAKDDARLGSVEGEWKKDLTGTAFESDPEGWIISISRDREGNYVIKDITRPQNMKKVGFLHDFLYYDISATGSEIKFWSSYYPPRDDKGRAQGMTDSISLKLSADGTKLVGFSRSYWNGKPREGFPEFSESLTRQ